MPYHGTSSTFAVAPTRPLTRNERRIWEARSTLRRRAGEITALHVEIGRCLIKRVGRDGRCDPCHQTIADDAGCTPRTVSEALRRFRRLGMLHWWRRLVRVDRVVQQTSNAYYFLLGQAPDKKEEAKLPGSKECSSSATVVPMSEAEWRERTGRIAALAWT